MEKPCGELKRDKTGWIAIVALLISVIAVCWNVTWSIVLEQARNRAHLEVWEHHRIINESVGLSAGAVARATPDSDDNRTIRATPVTPQSGDNRTVIILLFRNLSARPTAIISICAKEKEAVLGDYKDQTGWPIKIEPWGVKKAEIKMESNDATRMTDIVIEDMDGNKIKVPSGSHRQTEWNKEKSKKISIFKALYDFVLDL